MTLEMLKELTAPRSVSGGEASISDKISQLAAPYADEIYNDVIGNLIVRKKGDGKRVLLAMHMDSIGLIATYIEVEGFIRFATVGGVRVDTLAGTRVRFGDVRGVVMADGGVKPADLKADKMYIDIGTNSREESEKLIRIGDTAVFDTETVAMSGDIVASAYMDNRIGCYVALETLKNLEDCPNDVYFVFTAQEEVGIRGAGVAAFAIEPEYSLSIDVGGTADTPDPELKTNVKLGGGPIIKIIDARTIYHREVIKLLEDAAKTSDIPIQYDATQFGGTDSGLIHTSRTGVKSGNISIPTRYIHTPTEMVSMSDACACVRLMTAFLNIPL